MKEARLQAQQIGYPRERVLANVKRWSTIPTIRMQSVAEHSFNVAVLAPRVAQVIRWTADVSHLMWLQRWALLHDASEGIMGDAPTPLKRRINGAYKMAEEEFLTHFHPELTTMTTRIRDGVQPWPDIVKIVKFCDYVEATQFLVEEMMFGNNSIRPTYIQLRDRAGEWFFNLPFGPDIAEDEGAMQAVYKNFIWPMISDEPREWEVIE